MNERWNRAPAEGGELEYVVQGDGEPVLLIHGSHVADAFLPLMTEPALAGYRLILYHRRGYAGSARLHSPFSVADQAADARTLLRHLGISQTHVAGHSYGAVTALQLAHDAPDVVQSLSLLEPSLPGLPSSEAMMAGLMPAIECYQSGDRIGAVDAFMGAVVSPEWRVHADRAVPGGAEQAYADAATFFEVELPALGEWAFDSDHAARVAAPVLWVIGSDSGRLAREGRDRGREWFPAAVDAVIEGADHLLQVQEPRLVAETLASMLAAHPIQP